MIEFHTGDLVASTKDKDGNDHFLHGIVYLYPDAAPDENPGEVRWETPTRPAPYEPSALADVADHLIRIT